MLLSVRTLARHILSLGLIIISATVMAVRGQNAVNPSKEGSAQKALVTARDNLAKSDSQQPDTIDLSDEVRQLKKRIDQLQSIIEEQQNVLADLKDRIVAIRDTRKDRKSVV